MFLRGLSKQTLRVPPSARKGELYNLFYNFKVKNSSHTNTHASTNRKATRLLKILPSISKNGSFYSKTLSKQTLHVPPSARKGELYNLFLNFIVKNSSHTDTLLPIEKLRVC